MRERGADQAHLHSRINVRDRFPHSCRWGGVKGRGAWLLDFWCTVLPSDETTPMPANSVMRSPAHHPTEPCCAPPSAAGTVGCAGPGPPTARTARWRAGRRAGCASPQAPARGRSLQGVGGKDGVACRPTGMASGGRCCCPLRTAAAQVLVPVSVITPEPRMLQHGLTRCNGHQHHVLLRRHAAWRIPGVDHDMVQFQPLQSCTMYRGRQGMRAVISSQAAEAHNMVLVCTQQGSCSTQNFSRQDVALPAADHQPSKPPSSTCLSHQSQGADA